MNAMDIAVDHAKVAKTHAFKVNLFGGNMPTLVEFFRADLPVATIHVRGANRDIGLRVAGYGSLAFNADLVFMSSDTYGINEVVSEEWDGKSPREVYDIVKNTLGAGELQRRWEAGDREGITEALAVSQASRSGPTQTVQIPYTVTPGKRRRLHFHRRSAVTDTVGTVPDALVDAIRSPNLTERALQMLGPDFLKMDETTRFATGDAAAMTLLPKYEPGVMLGMLYSASGDVVRREILDKTLGP